ncbi:MAG: hypothetical protein WEA10_10295 [Actinomycetota bacterium]
MWVVAVLTVSLVAGALVYVLSLRVTEDGPSSRSAQGARWPSRKATQATAASAQPLPRSLQLTIPGITYLPVSTIRTPARARLFGILGLLLVVAITAVVLTLIVVVGGRIFGDALESYFGS